MDEQQQQQIDATILIDVMRGRIAELEWDLMVTRAQLQDSVRASSDSK